MVASNRTEADLADVVMSVVLAGGQGTRLFPLTLKRCKPAISFGSRFRLIDIPISNSLNSGIRHIAVISQYFASELNQHIASSYRLDKFGSGQFYLLCPEETLDEKKTWYKGTADAVRQNLEHLLETKAEYFLILSGDQLYTFDFREMVKFAKQKEADLVVASLVVQEKEAMRMGLLKVDEKQQIIDFYEKPEDPAVLKKFALQPSSQGSGAQYLGSMGIYIFKRAALISILQEKGHDFGKHIIPLQLKKGKAFSFAFHGYWEDIGTIGSYYEANMALTKREHGLNIYNEKHPIYCEPLFLPGAYVAKTKVEYSILGQGSQIYAGEVHESIIGLNAVIGRGSKIHQSIILGGHGFSTIGEHCQIQKCIIDENVKIGNQVKLINKKSHQDYDGDGIFVRDGVIIVVSGMNIPDGFIF